MQNATLLEVSSEWSFGYQKYVRFNFFFQVALENTKICVQLSIFKTDQAFPDTLPWICGIFPQNSHLCGRDVFSCLKNIP